MNAKTFLLLVIAIIIGATVALGIAGLYLKTQVTAATSGNSTIGSLLSLFGVGSSTTTSS